MAGYDPYDRGYSRRYVREERDPRYLDSRDYRKQYPSRELVPRAREDSDLSVEEIRRDFPPPSGRDIRRARSAEAGYYGDDGYYRRAYQSPRHDRDADRSSRHRPASTYYEEELHRPKPPISKNEKLMAAVAGAALLAGGKELYDRYEAKEDHHRVERNPLSMAALAGVGALAAYQGADFYNKQQEKKDMKTKYLLRGGRAGDYPSDEEDDPEEKKGHKSFLESALSATGLGAAVKSFTGGGDRDDRSDRGSRRDSGGSTSSRSQSRAHKIQKVAVASLLTGAAEAFRVAKEPGGWKGEKAKRVLTAAASAAAVDGAYGDKHGALGLAESVIGGLISNRLINGSRNNIEEDEETGRSRSRSRARSGSRGRATSGLAALAATGLGALGAKKVLDSSRSRSRGRHDDSRSPPRRSRSRSIVDRARDGLAKLGIGSGAGEADRRRDPDDYSDRGSPRARHHSDEDDYDDGYGYGRGGRDSYDREGQRYRGGQGDRSLSGHSGGRSGSESDLGDTDEDEKRAKKMRGKQILTTGLAAVATIHAVHEVYQSVEKRKARKKAVKEGRLSEAEAKKLKTKALIQDAASVGIAAIGIKGAVEEMKEAKELSHECREFMEEKERRHKRREERRRLGHSPHPSSGGPGNGSRSRPPSSRDSGHDDGYDGYMSDDDDDDDDGGGGGGYGYGYGPRHQDHNRYGALPAPPVGESRRR